MIDKEQNQAGVALPMALIVITVITILGFTAAYAVDSQTQMLSHFRDREMALYIAEAGMEEYLNNLKIDPNFYSDPEGLDFIATSRPVSFAGMPMGYYTVQVNPSSIDNASPLDKKIVKITVKGETASNPNIIGIVEVEAQRTDLTDDLIDDLIDGDTSFQHPLPSNSELIKAQIGKLKSFADNSKYNSYHFQGRTCLYFDDNNHSFYAISGWNPSRNAWDNNGYKEIDNSYGGVIIYVEGKTDYDTDYEKWGTQEDSHKWDLEYGNVFISGTIKNNVTIIADNNIYITAMDPTRDFDYRNTAPPGVYVPVPDEGVLGLVAGGTVQILHGNWPDNDPDHVAAGKLFTIPEPDPNQPFNPINYPLYTDQGDPVTDENGENVTVYDTSSYGFNIDAAIIALNGNLGLELYKSYPTGGRCMSKLIFNGCVFQSDPDYWEKSNVPPGGKGGRLFDPDPFTDPVTRLTFYSGYNPIVYKLNPHLFYPKSDSVYHNFYFPGATWTVKSWVVKTEIKKDMN